MICKKNIFEIKHQIFDDVNAIIKEEMGISDEVSRMSNEIFNEIKRNVKNIKSSVIDNGYGVKEGDFTKDVFGKKLTVFFKQHNFKDKTYYNDYVQKYGVSAFDSISSQRYLRNNRLIYNMVSIVFVTISGHLNESEIKQDIQHELQHIYQQTKMNKSFGNDDLYRLVYKHIYSTNKIEWAIAMVLYMSFKSEIEAFANGLYSYVTANLYNGHINTIFQKTDAYKKINTS
jgi:hypothetical protein